MVPDAVLVGGSAAALYAGHRDSYDHDHVLPDLRERWTDWAEVRSVGQELAAEMLEADADGPGIP
jgi:hypothetical protein